MKFSVFILGFAVVQLALAQDLPQIKVEALKRIEAEWTRMVNTNKEVGAQLPFAESKMGEIAQEITEAGARIKERITTNINRLVGEYTAKADLLESSDDVYKCINDVKRRSIASNDKNYNENFYKVLQKTSYDGFLVQRDEVLEWNREYHYAMKDYEHAHERVQQNIKSASDSNRVEELVENFGKQTNEMIRLTKSVFSRISRILVKVKGEMYKIFNNYKETVPRKIEETARLLQQCFNTKPSLDFLKKSIY